MLDCIPDRFLDANINMNRLCSEVGTGGYSFNPFCRLFSSVNVDVGDNDALRTLLGKGKARSLANSTRWNTPVSICRLWLKHEGRGCILLTSTGDECVAIYIHFFRLTRSLQ